MNFIILGAGAIGCYVGGQLTCAGHNVVFVGRPRVLDVLRRDGLRVSDPDGFDMMIKPASLRLSDSLAEALTILGKVQGAPTLLVCVKGTATQSVARDIANNAPHNSVVISLQNGINNANQLRELAPRMRVHAGMVPYTVMWRNDHHVHRSNGGLLHVENTVETQSLAAAMSATGVPLVLRDDMTAVQWGKLLLNLLNPVNALANLPIREQLLQRDYRVVLAALQSEALGVLKVANIQPAKVAAVSPNIVPKILRLPNWLFTRIAAGMLKMDPGARTSMCADLHSGRMTEIDDLCGEVVRLAQRHSINTPLNSMMIELVTHHKSGKPWSGESLRQALQI